MKINFIKYHFPILIYKPIQSSSIIYNNNNHYEIVISIKPYFRFKKVFFYIYDYYYYYFQYNHSFCTINTINQMTISTTFYIEIYYFRNNFDKRIKKKKSFAMVCHKNK